MRYQPKAPSGFKMLSALGQPHNHSAPARLVEATPEGQHLDFAFPQVRLVGCVTDTVLHFSILNKVLLLRRCERLVALVHCLVVDSSQPLLRFPLLR